jgi:hypothetical protein
LVELCPKFEDENLSEKFSADMEFCRIGPCSDVVDDDFG